MDDSDALYELISVLKDHVIDQVGFFLDRRSTVGADDDARGDDAARSSSDLDRLAAASIDFPFLSEVRWDAEREWRAARRRLRVHGVKENGRKACEEERDSWRECRAEGCSKQRQHRCEGYCISCFGSSVDGRRDDLSSPREEDDAEIEEGQKEGNDDGRLVHEEDKATATSGVAPPTAHSLEDLGIDHPITDAAGRKRTRERIRVSWDENLAEFARWKEEHGHPHVPYKGEHGRLGQWVRNQRVSYKLFKEGKKIKGGVVMTEERVAKLREAGFVFEGRRGRPFSDMSEEPPIADVLEEGESEA